ncbi:intracellular adhesion protein IcaD [Staphylococcus caeli]|uniref:intracellular adhesion protein IcaD n=1 Tax=Staphylococcus caeli TaxID=2201815 RepID=UPI003F5484A6
MVQSRQGQYQTLKSHLNIIREGIILIFSFMFWSYCSISFVVIGGSLLQINSYPVLLIRTILNIELASMHHLFEIMFIFTVISLFIFTSSLLIYKYKNKDAHHAN